LYQRLNLGLAKVQKMPRIIEGKAVLLVGTTEAADLLFSFIETVGGPREMIGCAEARQACADDDDHAVRGPSSTWDARTEDADFVRSIRFRMNVDPRSTVTVPRQSIHATCSPTVINMSPMPPTTAVER